MLTFTIILAAIIAVAVWALTGNDNPYKLPKE